MKIGVLSDIHGNHYALQAVLTSAKKQDVQCLLVLGDIVGYYYHPDKVLDLLSDWNYWLIQGNHEGFIKGILDEEIKWDAITVKYGKGLQFAFEKLDKAVLKNLAALPHQQLLTFESVGIRMCHGSPWDRDTYIYPDASTELIERCSSVEADFVVMGHTHYPCAFKDERSFIANSGSVGQSRVAGGVANWALINTANKAYVAQATPYNTAKLIEEVTKTDPQMPYLAAVLTR